MYKKQKINYSITFRKNKIVQKLRFAHTASAGGNLIHRMFGENLPHTFKTFDIFDRATKKVTSLKSLDLGAQTYQDTNKICSVVKGMIDKVVTFKEYHLTPKGRKIVMLTSDMIDARVLHLIVPKGATYTQRQSLLTMKQYAESQNITFIITEMF